MGRMYVTGDYHGGKSREKVSPDRWPEGQSLTADDVLVVCGDMGIVWDDGEADARERSWLSAMPWTTAYVDGNHDNHRLICGMPVTERWGGPVHETPGAPGVYHLSRGCVYEIAGISVFAMGGAQSSDRAMRIEGIDWWPEELPGAGEIDAARRALDAVGWKVDMVVTHTCSSAARKLMVSQGSVRPWDHPERDRLTDFLDELEAWLDYRVWYFGHFHVDAEVGGGRRAIYQDVVEACW